MFLFIQQIPIKHLLLSGTILGAKDNGREQERQGPCPQTFDLAIYCKEEPSKLVQQLVLKIIIDYD